MVIVPQVPVPAPASVPADAIVGSTALRGCHLGHVVGDSDGTATCIHMISSTAAGGGLCSGMMPIAFKVFSCSGNYFKKFLYLCSVELFNGAMYEVKE